MATCVPAAAVLRRELPGTGGLRQRLKVVHLRIGVPEYPEDLPGVRIVVQGCLVPVRLAVTRVLLRGVVDVDAVRLEGAAALDGHLEEPRARPQLLAVLPDDGLAVGLQAFQCAVAPPCRDGSSAAAAGAATARPAERRQHRRRTAATARRRCPHRSGGHASAQDDSCRADKAHGFPLQADEARLQSRHRGDRSGRADRVSPQITEPPSTMRKIVGSGRSPIPTDPAAQAFRLAIVISESGGPGRSRRGRLTWNARFRSGAVKSLRTAGQNLPVLPGTPPDPPAP